MGSLSVPLTSPSWIKRRDKKEAKRIGRDGVVKEKGRSEGK